MKLLSLLVFCFMLGFVVHGLVSTIRRSIALDREIDALIKRINELDSK